jgi:glucose/mannose transport system substrate-binding protein
MTGRSQVETQGVRISEAGFLASGPQGCGNDPGLVHFERGIMKLRLSTMLVVCGVTAFVAIGCGSSGNSSANGTGGAPGATGETLELFSWWVAPGEAEALRALETTYQLKNTGARVDQAINDTTMSWQDVLYSKVEASPWDVFQWAAADLPKLLMEHPGAVQPLDDYYDEPSLKAAVIPEILKTVTVDGHVYGIVTGVHRNNAFLYNKQIFDALQLAPPTTVPEFLAACVTLKAAGTTPVATTFQGWALRIMFDDILAGTLGAADFDAFIKGTKSVSDPDIQAGITSAVDTFTRVLTDYVDLKTSKADSYGWSQAAEALHIGQAAMLFHGDWAKGYLVQLGWTPGVDFGVSGPPGASDLFVYGADMFGLPTTAPHPQAAKDFLTVVASQDGQVAFNKYKGATPMRTDVRDRLDAPGQTNLDDLVNAKVLMASHANSDWEAAIAAYATDGDKDALLAVYLKTTP